MGKLIGYARVSTRQQSSEEQEAVLEAAGVLRVDLYVDHVAPSALAERPIFNRAFESLRNGDTLVVTTLGQLGRSTQSMLSLADAIRGRGANLRILNFNGTDVETATPTGSMLFEVMAALREMEQEIKRERADESLAERRYLGLNLGGRPQSFSEDQIRTAQRLIASGKPVAQVARNLGMSRATLYRRSRTLLEKSDR